MIKYIKNLLKNVDKGLYFHLFLLFTVPIVFLIFGWIIAFFYVFVVAILHSILIVFCPYIKNSEYYRYFALKQKFYEDRKKYTLPFSPVYAFCAKSFLLVSFFWMFQYPSSSTILFPGQLIAVLIYTTYTSVEILNIISRPRLPEAVFKYHPLLQKRYGPLVDVVVNKVIPVCAKTGGILFSTYVGFVGLYKGLHGVNSIDPARNFLLNQVHQFPASHRWTETELSLWTQYTELKTVSSLDHKEKVEQFLRTKDILREKMEKVVTGTLEAIKEKDS